MTYSIIIQYHYIIKYNKNETLVGENSKSETNKKKIRSTKSEIRNPGETKKHRFHRAGKLK